MNILYRIYGDLEEICENRDLKLTLSQQKLLRNCQWLLSDKICEEIEGEVAINATIVNRSLHIDQ